MSYSLRYFDMDEAKCKTKTKPHMAQKQRLYSEFSFKCFFFFDYLTGTLIGSNEAKPIPLHQGTMVACCANDLVNKNRVIKRRAGFIATASL